MLLSFSHSLIFFFLPPPLPASLTRISYLYTRVKILTYAESICRGGGIKGHITSSDFCCSLEQPSHVSQFPEAFYTPALILSCVTLIINLLLCSPYTTSLLLRLLFSGICLSHPFTLPFHSLLLGKHQAAHLSVGCFFSPHKGTGEKVRVSVL